MSTGPHGEGGPRVAPPPLCDAILFQLLLRGPLGDAELAAATGTAEPVLAIEIADLVGQGLLARELRAGREQVVLTATGRDRTAVVIEAEASSLRPFVAPLDAEFGALNRRVKQILYRWQVRVDRTTEVLNDHADPRYDAQVLADLRAVHLAADRLLARLEPLRARYASLRRRLAAALARAGAGERGAVAGVTGDSFHAAWWELHADLLLVLGRGRGPDDA